MVVLMISSDLDVESCKAASHLSMFNDLSHQVNKASNLVPVYHRSGGAPCMLLNFNSTVAERCPGHHDISSGRSVRSSSEPSSGQRVLQVRHTRNPLWFPYQF